MNRNILETAIKEFQKDLFDAITSSCYNGKLYANGQKAKEALIRSQSLILHIHEAVKIAIFNHLKNLTSYHWDVYPPIGLSSTELKIYGALKGKDQDIVFLRDKRSKYIFTEGPNLGQVDNVGTDAIQNAIVLGIRSQMSSVDKNFDTLMERAFAETLNLRLRVPALFMAEVYVIPIKELDDRAMLSNMIQFNSRPVKIEKFVRTFDSFTGRNSLDMQVQYKYDATCLVLIDLESNPARVIYDSHDLKEFGFSEEVCKLFKKISPLDFDNRVINNYKRIQSLI